MEDKRRAGSIMLAMLMGSFYLFYEYAPQYLLPIGLLVATWPLIFLAGRSWERHLFDGYLDYLREVGDLVDPEQPRPAPQPQPPQTWQPDRIRQRPPRSAGNN